MKNSCEVLDVRWSRALLTIDVEVPRGADVDFVLGSAADGGQVELPIASHRIGECVYRLAINVVTFHDRKPVPNGRWLLLARHSGEASAVGFGAIGDARFDEWSRAFVVDEGQEAYTVNFGPDEHSDSLDLVISTFAFGSQKQALWPRVKRSILRTVFRVSRATRKSGEDRVLFASDASPRLQGNLLAVHERMVERGLDQQFDFDYLFRSAQTMSRGSALSLGWKLGRADIILIDDYFPIIGDLLDASNQKVIQLWHAGSGFKSVGYTRFGQIGSPRLVDAQRRYTFAICGSEYLRDVYAEVFGIERESVIPTGLPRVDFFLRDGREAEASAAFAEAYPLAADKRKILFAPTYRGAGDGGATYDYSTLDLAALHAACGDDTVVLVRQHHLLRDPAPIPHQLRDRLIDVSSFADTNDLLLVSDVLVTDYSSIIYEYSLLRRPMIFFAPDLDTYAVRQGMHRDFREVAPGEVATDFERLLELIAAPELSVDKTEAFVAENFDYIDTDNSDRVIDQLIVSDPRLSTATPTAASPEA